VLFGQNKKARSQGSVYSYPEGIINHLKKSTSKEVEDMIIGSSKILQKG
jgi:hypothetical protein